MMKKIGILVAALVIGGSVSAMQELNTQANVELLVQQALEAGLVTQDEAQALALDKNADSSVSCSENKRKYIIAALAVLVAAGFVGAGYYLYTTSKVTEAPVITEPVITEPAIIGRTRPYLPRNAKNR